MPSEPAQTSSGATPQGKATRGMLAILYDGGCDMCRTSIQAIEKFDSSGKIEPIDLHNPEVRAKFPALETTHVCLIRSNFCAQEITAYLSHNNHLQF